MPEITEHTALVSSAGAGKTRALTKRFLALYLHKADYQLKTLYGITFTNEAAFEMKSRILGYLDLLIAGTAEDPADNEIIHCFKDHCADTRMRAGQRKQHLLNNLSEFNIYTFHSLFASFLSSMPFAAGILPGYRIIDEAHEAVIYDKVLDQYVEASHASRQRFERMKEYVRQNEGRFKDSTKRIYSSIVPWLDFLDRLIDQGQSKLTDNARSKASAFAEILQRLAGFIRAHESAAYTKNSTTMNKHISGLCRSIERFTDSQEFDILEGSEYTKAILRGDLTGKRYIADFRGRLNAAEHDFARLLNELTRSSRDYLSALSDQEIAVHLQPLLEIRNQFDKEKRARNLISFEDIEILTLAALRTNPDLDYLYFKLGAKIDHLMIDEFQDTSFRQLEIINPLIEEILSLDPVEKSLFYVGDPKQAIYRWRGGSSELFDYLIEKYPKKIKRRYLKINYRSRSEVIDFVNTVLDKKDQAEPDKTGGWIRVENTGQYDDREQGQQAIAERTCSIVRELVERYHYEFSDIAVLLRTNSFGGLVSDQFTSEGIPHTSSATSDLLSNADVCIVIKILEFLDDPENDFALLHALLSPYFDFDEEVLRRLMHPDKILYFSLRSAHPDWPAVKKLGKLLGMVHLTNPYDLIFNICQELDIEITYALAALLNVALDYVTDDAGHLSSFLNWLSDAGNTIQSSDMHVKGVSMLTVHKAKGLEFDIVILPETHWSLRSGEDPNLLFSYSMNNVEPDKIYWRRYGKYMHGLKDAEKARMQEDELNLLYVALTRAKTGIHILGYQGTKQNTGFWFDTILKKVGEFPYSRGEIGQKTPVRIVLEQAKEYGAIKRDSAIIKEERSLYSPTERDLELVDDAQRRSMEIGTMVHDALSRIGWLDHVDPGSYLNDIIEKVKAKYARSREEGSDIEERLIPLLHDVCSDPDLRSFFYKDGRAIEYKNEVSIYFEENKRDVSGQIDRLMIEPGIITIIDYKTGRVEEKYRQQLNIYRKGIEKIYDTRNIQGILVYLDKERGQRIISV
jgi:ATP-dependent exoDNAse (exonuclease V) beta subunit